jgi:glucose-6-phosphate 1-dehydrogenase
MDIVVFGASGHLANNKIFPALHVLYERGVLPKDTQVIGFSRTSKENVSYSFPYRAVTGDYANSDSVSSLKDILRPDTKHVFYLAVPPLVYGDLLGSINRVELVTKDDPSGFRLVLVEKPFGENKDNADFLIGLSKELFRSDQLLKIDHYAGKEELRSLEEEDFSTIESVTFEIFETADVVGREGYYNTVGALKDVGQNHLLFMLTTFFKGSDLREIVLKNLLLDTSSPLSKAFVFGSYEGYDKIETYFSISARLEREDTKHIAITLASGKALAENKVCIRVKYNSGEQKEIILVSGVHTYEHIFEDALQGKLSSFLSNDEVRESWRFIEEVEKVKSGCVMISYKKGSDTSSLTR